MSQNPSNQLENLLATPPSDPNANLESGTPPKPDTVAPGGNVPAGRASLEAAKATADPGKTLRGGGNTSVQSPEEADQLRARSSPQVGFAPVPEPVVENLEPYGYTPLTAHPPLKPGDKIQGPHDRNNRPPTEKEIEAGKLASMDMHLDENEVLVPPEPVDPPIDENAPEDKPADLRKVAEERGQVKTREEALKTGQLRTV